VDTVLTDALRPFDVAIAAPLLSRISLNTAARCLAIAMRAMAPGARLYAAWIENPDPFAVPDAPPVEDPYELVAGLGQALRFAVDRVARPTHPRGESPLIFTRACSPAPPPDLMASRIARLIDLLSRLRWTRHPLRAMPNADVASDQPAAGEPVRWLGP